MNIPRPEYPRPQFQRETWKSLNGQWTCKIQQNPFIHQNVEMEREKYKNSTGFDSEITVPFAPESSLSGIGYRDFIEAMYYQRLISIPSEWEDKLILLNFGAVDYRCEIYIDGNLAGRHSGGSSSFSIDITEFVQTGKDHNLVVMVWDELRSGNQTGGKQSFKYESYGCFYTRTTGIWQSVWMEAVHPMSLNRIQINSDIDNKRLTIVPEFYNVSSETILNIKVLSGSKIVSEENISCANGIPSLLPIAEPIFWEPGNPHLYDIELTVLKNDNILDRVKSYTGMRKIHIEGNRLYLNNKPLYSRLVLDQGFYPDGIWTAPSDEDLKRDIELSMKAGFNGARLHQKVFEERFHYWADKLGYLTWGETASWGLAYNKEIPARNFLSEWREIVLRDRNHPSIIAWTPLNESWKYEDPEQHYRIHTDAYELAHALDPTRPVNDASGYIHHRTDLWTVHNYTQDPEKLRRELSLKKGEVFRNFPEIEPPYSGQPYIIDEFGGIKWSPESQKKEDWGYGDAPSSEEEYYKRLEGQVNGILELDHICGYCFTQLTDVEQETNGIYNYDRTEKFDMKRIEKIFRKEPEVY